MALNRGHFFGWNGPSLAHYRWGRFFGTWERESQTPNPRVSFHIARRPVVRSNLAGAMSIVHRAVAQTTGRGPGDPKSKAPDRSEASTF
jgi:hypothetical protein